MFEPLSFDDPFTLFLIVVATVMMLGYLLGRWVNDRRGQRISAWLEPGLRSLGGTPFVQRLSRSTFRVKVIHAGNPFSTVTVSVVLISREVLPRWLWERLHRRRDLVVFHVSFRRPPVLEAEILDPSSELGQRGESQAQDLGWSVDDLPDGRRLYWSAETPLARVEAMAKETARRPFTPWRVAVRHDAPHLLVSMPVPELDGAQSTELARLLVSLSRLAHAGDGDDAQ